MTDLADVAAQTIGKGAQNAATMAPETSMFDVWGHSANGISERMRENVSDPVGALTNDLSDLASSAENVLRQDLASASVDEWIDSAIAQQDQLGRDFGSIVSGSVQNPDGSARELTAIERVGMSFGMLTGLEQMISTMLSVIPFPAFPALRITDMDIGFPHAHSHPPNFTPPATPSPIPFPMTGPIIPIPLLSGASKTLINGMPAARCGDMGIAVWCGGWFPFYEVFLGSSSVWIEGARAGRVLCDVTKHCIFSAPRPSDVPIYTFLGTTISASPNVMIGGVPMPSLSSMVAGAAFGAAFRQVGRLVRRAQATRLGTALARRAQAVTDRAGRALGLTDRMRDRLGRGLCHLLGHPVDPATGKVLAEATDALFDGPLPLRFARVWVSTSAYAGPLGMGWHHSYDLALVITPVATILRWSDGRQIQLPGNLAERPLESAPDGLSLSLEDSGPRLIDSTGLIYAFELASNEFGVQKLTSIENPDGEIAQLRYNHANHLCRIEVSDDIWLELENDPQGRITAIAGPDPDTGQKVVLRSYLYDLAGDLVSVDDTYGYQARYAYQRHMLIREEDRNGFGYNFEYDRYDMKGRCLRTWGDGNVMDLAFEYDLIGKTTTVSNATGQRVYGYDTQGRVTEVQDAAGGLTRYQYSADNELVAEIGAEGEELLYDGDEVITRSKGIVLAKRPQAPPADDLPMPDVKRDLWGRVTERRFKGLKATYQWDLENRIMLTTRQAGNERYTYDAGGRLVARKDTTGAITRFAYAAERLPVTEERPDGSQLFAEYDHTQELTEITDANGEALRFKRDGEGRLSEVRTEGGRMLQRIARDKAGARQHIQRPLTSRRIARKASHMCLARTYLDSDATQTLETTELFDTKRNERRSESAEINTSVTYNDDGLKIAETFAGAKFEMGYDDAGRLEALKTPWGDVTYAYGEDGLLLTDPLGQTHFFGAEKTHRLANGVEDRTTWTGAPEMLRSIRRGGTSLYEAKVAFGTNGLRETEVENELSRRFTYDALDRLTAAGQSAFGYDAEFNLTNREDRTFRYKDDQQIAADGQRLFAHDNEGRRIRDTYPDGSELSFAYDPRGFLARASCPQRALDMHYTYDLRGRRVSKTGNDGALSVKMRYIWSGPRLMAECSDVTGQIRFYIYLPLTADKSCWTPVAFIDLAPETAPKIYTVHLGLGPFPVLVLDAQGAPVWRAQYAPLGAAIEEASNTIVFDLRLPGQSLDRETGLHYNRYRHYDPQISRYLQVDPLFPVNAARRYAYSEAPLDRHDLLALAYECSKGNRWGRRRRGRPPTAHEIAATQGIRNRMRLARERILRGEYDPLVDTIPADELEEFLDTGRLSHTTEQVDMHHTVQKSSDPSMADEVESIQPVTNSEHAVEHDGDYGATPTAGIRGDVTNPDRPIYDPNDPDVQAGAYSPNYGHGNDDGLTHFDP